MGRMEMIIATMVAGVDAKIVLEEEEEAVEVVEEVVMEVLGMERVMVRGQV